MYIPCQFGSTFWLIQRRGNTIKSLAGSPFLLMIFSISASARDAKTLVKNALGAIRTSNSQDTSISWQRQPDRAPVMRRARLAIFRYRAAVAPRFGTVSKAIGWFTGF
jgi:hypothetical protein